MKDTSKYYYNSKSKKWFPFKKRKFDTSKHTIFKSEDKCTYKAECLLSYQENQMLKGLSNSLQTNLRDTLRISIHHLHQEGCMIDKGFQEKAKATSKERGHTSRTQKLSVRITKDEMLKLDDIAEINYLSIKEGIRLTFIWMSKGIKEDSIKKIKNCKEIKADVQANKWKASQTEFKRDENVGKLKEIREFWKQYYQDERDRKNQEAKETGFYNKWKYTDEPSPEDIANERFEEILRKEGLKRDKLNHRDRSIYSMMARLQVDYESACLFYEDDVDEFKRLSKMSAYELMEYMRAEQQARKDREYQEVLAKNAKQREARKQNAYRRLVEDGTYPSCLSWESYNLNPLKDYEIEVILENGIRTKEQLDADIQEHRTKVEKLIEEGKKYFALSDLNNEKRIIHLYKTDEYNSNYQTFQQENWSNERWELFNTYDDWIEEYLREPESHKKLIKRPSWLDDVGSKSK